MDIDGEESAMNAGPSTGAASGSTEEARPEAMSKNAMKRAAKQARMEAVKPLKRAAEKERRKIRTAQLAKGYAEGTLTEEEREIVERRKRLEKQRKVARRKAEHGEEGDGWGGGVVVDLGFDELMNEQEIASMSQQLGYLYSTNRTAKLPIKTILHTTFSPAAAPRLWEKMVNSNWGKWNRCYWWSEGLDNLKSALDGKSTAPFEKGPSSTEKEGLEGCLSGPNLPSGLEAGKHKLVYLSADAEEELSTLSEDEVYIIGGIVDRNRYKNLCQDKAEKLGIRTARLPIGTYLANLPTRKVLTVNQVFEILLRYLELQDWAAAFEAVIPQRKFMTSGRKTRRKQGGEEGKEDGEEHESDHDEVGEEVNEAAEDTEVPAVAES
ncbi:hypothetical protein CI109_102565 [Kwoniella shandongensis]|uniref:tRNA (guanine(9)-N1)-methyltransferase n=1 Tax=Kwoniella shandongensis TaxID=1734106 RepID=A0A5M6BSL9_9TREE|nr:uncharacterized protein CI109_005819 [Kwoniella shandongensis]KAA5525797.1 hypothetical protein CI109_005819 [Kwoniella shandongensis]